MNKIEEIRKLRGYSRGEAAKKIGITAVMLGYLENGKRSLSQKWLDKISAALNCTKAQLLGEQAIDGIKNTSPEPKYAIKEEYIEKAINIVDSITDAEELTRLGRAKVLADTYKLVHDFYELGIGKEEFLEFIKTETKFTKGNGKKEKQ